MFNKNEDTIFNIPHNAFLRHRVVTDDGFPTCLVFQGMVGELARCHVPLCAGKLFNYFRSVKNIFS